MWPFSRKSTRERKAEREFQADFRKACKVISARYDAAQTTTENTKHWQWADGASAASANSPGVRATLRNRARYEIANNSYMRGMVDQIADDMIGTGPRLRFVTANDADDRLASELFADWMEATGLTEKLTTMVKAKVGDGEVFAMLSDNPRHGHDVSLDVRLYEADQCASPSLIQSKPNAVDGIEFDEYGNPVRYEFLKAHPGDSSFPFKSSTQYDWVDAESVIHYFRASRPGQLRGIPDIMAALPLGAHLRRYTLASILAAEIAADFALVIQSSLAASQDAQPTPYDTIPLERGMMNVLPDGWQLGQAKAEQPTNTYKEFKREIIGEQGACLRMPFNIAAANSEGMNYSSGRLDHQTYRRMIVSERARFVRIVLNRIVRAWLAQAQLIDGYLPQSMRLLKPTVRWKWAFDGFSHVDPQKERAADDIALKNGTATLADILADDGKDWEEHLDQLEREYKSRAARGLPQPESSQPAQAMTSEPEEAVSNA